MPRVDLGFFMTKNHRMQAALELLKARYAERGIELRLSLKPVKNVNFRYHHPQLRVSAPKHISADHLQTLVIEKLSWAEALFKKHQHEPTQEVKGIFSADLKLGDRVKFWGEPAVLVTQASTQTAWSDPSGLSELAVGLGHESLAPELMEAYRQALKSSLGARLNKRMDYWSAVTGLKPSKIRIKLMRSRWGSCSHQKGSISISLAIAMYDPECLDALIVHELCHLKHANHGRHFWDLVYHYLPNYQQIHSRLR